jgi:spore germination protein YaaH
MAEPSSSRGRLAPIAIALAGIVAIVVVGLAWPKGEWQRTGAPITVSGWAPYWQPDSALASFTENSDLFADVALVAYSARGAREVVTYEGMPDGTIERYRTATAAVDVPLIATVFDNAGEGVMAGVLADPAQRTAHVATLVALVRNGDYAGIELDYEVFAFGDSRTTWATTRPNWIAFLTELDAALEPTGAALMVAVPPVYDGGQSDISGYWVYDYEAMGKIVDRIRIMAYDYSIAKPGPIAPIEWVDDLVQAATELVDPAKLDLGIPTYGYDWVLSVTGTCPDGETPERRAISNARAGRELAARGITPVWDETTAEYAFDYVDTLTGPDANGATVTCTVSRTVRYPGADGAQRRAYIAHRNDLHGVALWALGNDDPATWAGIRAARLGEMNNE